MFLFHKLLYLLGSLRDSAFRSYRLNEQIHVSIVELAHQEQRSEDEVHADLLASALAQHQFRSDLWDRWSALSPREQQVAVLVCRGYTNNEIAARLGIAPTTVKTHVKNVLTKYHFHSKDELRIALENWDFRAWD